MPALSPGGRSCAARHPPRGAGLHRLMVRSARPRRARQVGILLWILPPETFDWDTVSRPAGRSGAWPAAMLGSLRGKATTGTTVQQASVITAVPGTASAWAVGELIVPGEGSGGIVGAVWRH